MIPPFFFTETTETEIFQINWNAIFCINYLIISLLEEEESVPVPVIPVVPIIFSAYPFYPYFYIYLYIYNI